MGRAAWFWAVAACCACHLRGRRQVDGGGCAAPGDGMNGRATVTATRMGSRASRPKRVRTSPGCAQLAVTAVPSSLRASSRVNKMFASLLLA